MSSKKKRNKQYKGSGSTSPTSVVRVSAVKRHPLHQWWIDKRRVAKPVLIVSAVVAVIVIVIIGIIDIIL
jgi:hypothetical protein